MKSIYATHSLLEKGQLPTRSYCKFQNGDGDGFAANVFWAKKTLAVNGEWQKKIIDFLTLINEPGALPLALI